MTVSSIKLPRKTGRVVRAVVASWRRLTESRSGDRRTLIACSGGGDSCGLVLALAAGVSRAADQFIVGHVVHDLRPREEALADRDGAERLAIALGLDFECRTVHVRAEGGNAEGAARRLRYGALAELAKANWCRYVATAHQGDDQLESILMALVRGAGPTGLAGSAAARWMAGARVIRPAMSVTREDLRDVCREAGWEWREDATNADTTRVRAALRHGVIPRLDAIRPGVARRAARSVDLIADAAEVVADRSRLLVARAAQDAERAPHVERRAGDSAPAAPNRPASREFSWPREVLQSERRVVLGTLIRSAAIRLRGRRSLDRLGLKTIAPLIRSIRSRGTDPKRFVLRGLEAEVTAHAVTLRCTDG